MCPDNLTTPQPPSNTDIPVESYIAWTVEIVSGYLVHNAVPVGDIPAVISSVYSCLTQLSQKREHAAAVSVENSIHDEFLICLEDGKKLKTLRRYLQRVFNMTPDDYRKKWGLPDHYPMVAPAYSRTRSLIARRSGAKDEI